MRRVSLIRSVRSIKSFRRGIKYRRISQTRERYIGSAAYRRQRTIRRCPAINQNPSVRHDRHTIAEHIPTHALSRNLPSLQVPNGGFVIRIVIDWESIVWVVSGTRDNQHFSGIQKSGVDRIDRHRVRKRGPPPVLRRCHWRGGSLRRSGI